MAVIAQGKTTSTARADGQRPKKMATRFATTTITKGRKTARAPQDGRRRTVAGTAAPASEQWRVHICMAAPAKKAKRASATRPVSSVTTDEATQRALSNAQLDSATRRANGSGGDATRLPARTRRRRPCSVAGDDDRRVSNAAANSMLQ
ncbi:hypothetical protein Scep_009397 [Stephania cephalantha]|uniref:Uncharacterized protein n=1 Tax=Stephania cephalantha TaxID=152367 RepID=A0AAP0JT40_9MAGN